MNLNIKNFNLRNIITVILIALPIVYWSQNVLDSLQNKVKVSKENEKVEVLLALSEYFQTRDFVKALNYAKKAKEYAIQNNDSAGMAKAYSYSGFALTDLGELKAAIENYQTSIEISQAIHDSAILALNYNDLGYIFEIQHLNDQAISYYLKALNIFEQLKDSMSMAAVYNNVGMLYSEENKQNTAREYYFKALEIKERISPENSLATTLNNIGVSYLEEYAVSKDTRLLNEAEKYFNKALDLRLKAQNLPGIAQTYINLSALYSHKNNIEKALEYAEKAYDIHQLNNNTYGLIEALERWAAINREQKKYQEANEKLIKALKYAKKINNRKKISEIYVMMGRNFHSDKKYKQAAENYDKYITLHDSLQQLDISNKINQIGLKYEFDKKLKEKELEHLQKQHENEIELNKQKFINYIIGISLALLLLITLVIFKAYKDKQKANEVISEQKKIVEEQRQALQTALADITDSVKYAKRIQQAILPPKEFLTKLFKKIEIIYKPKDIVSGDFYWAAGQGNKKMFALADCTGHGVPGAFMSLLGYNALNKIVNEEKITSPDKILSELDQYITTTLKQDNNKKIIRDGMDISFITIENNQLYFAGANNGIWIIRNNNITELPPDKQPIGHSQKTQNRKTFTLHTFDLQADDLIILFTDGFADQFGGENNKKLKTARLKKLILENAYLPLNKLKEKIETFFEEWKGNTGQIDDVSLVFIKV